MVIKKNPTGRFTLPRVREFGFRNPVNFCLEICRNQAGKCLVEFGILGVGIRNTLSSRNPDPANDWNPNNPNSPDKKFGIQFPETGIHSLEFTKTVLDSLTWGRVLPFYCTTCTWQPYNKFKKNNTLYLQVVGVLTYLCLLCNKLFHQAICCGEKALELRRY